MKIGMKLGKVKKFGRMSRGGWYVCCYCQLANSMSYIYQSTKYESLCNSKEILIERF